MFFRDETILLPGVDNRVYSDSPWRKTEQLWIQAISSCPFIAQLLVFLDQVKHCNFGNVRGGKKHFLQANRHAIEIAMQILQRSPQRSLLSTPTKAVIYPIWRTSFLVLEELCGMPDSRAYQGSVDLKTPPQWIDADIG